MKPKPGLARPRAVTVTIVVLWVQVGLLCLLSAITLALNSMATPQQQAPIVPVLAVVFLLSAAALGAVTVALTGGRNWARITLIVLNSLGLASSLFTLVNSGGDYRTFPAIILGITIISSLARAETRQWCLDRAYQRDRERRKTERAARKRPVRE